ncbi:MAG TPA: CocE/NonD family hydrolase [Candidatus Acidoferrales bacterium]|nr:CocE/NonD family hydrolase [Candidatus Acidoferrales bacterium]
MIQRMPIVTLVAGLALFFSGRTSRGARPAAQGTSLPDLFTKQEAMIPMRDGVRLHTEIYVPKNASGPEPFLITRTPYGVSGGPGGYSHLFAAYPEMVPGGYVFVFQDIRGRYGSEGQFVMQRMPCEPPRPGCIDEGTDTYDTIDWLVKHVPNNNGRAGLLGISYGGWLTAMALLHPHPALKAASEQASPADMFLGDDFHHNGAFRLSYGFEYAAMMETGKTNFLFHFNRYDTFDWYLRLGPLANVDKLYLHGELPTWENFVHHPNYDAFWKQQAAWPYFQNLTLTVPNLNVAGWWDQEDFYGPLRIYEASEAHDVHHDNYLVVGPWNHGGWSHGPGSSLGPIQFGSSTASYFRQNVQAAWFAAWLRGKGDLPLPKVLTFQTGSNRWMKYDAWPPAEGIAHRKLYFRSGSRLSFDPPGEAGATAFDSYLSDPARPVPYRHRPVEQTYGPGSHWYTWLVEDQRFVYLRPDTAAWETEPLDHDVTVTGDIVAHLFAATTGSDSDWVVKLIDVYPEQYPDDSSLGGYQLMIADEILRGRFRDSFEHPAAVTPNRVTPYAIDLHTNNHTFLKGHRIIVQVQSTWFPAYDRNPQKFVPNIFEARPADYQKASQRVYRSRRFASYIDLPVAVR